MRRGALLIGNSEGLPGVKVDITRFADFLQSETGGAWYEAEMQTMQNPRKARLLQAIADLKSARLDYVIVLFSGHGGQRRSTILELNGHGETIEEPSLRAISTRQLNVYDCCRALLVGAKSEAAALVEKARKDVGDSRRRYEARIMQAIPQQALLYSCSVGQVSYDTSAGGVYLRKLLEAAKDTRGTESFKTVGQAHQEAVGPTLANSLLEGQGMQKPEAVLAKCLTPQQLVISLCVS